MPRISLEQLDNLHVASPCPMTWDQLDGSDPHVRHCGDCGLNVYNISQLGRAQIADLIEQHEGQRLCGMLLQRADGTVITADCPVGLAAVRRKVVRTASRIAAALGMLITGGLVFAASNRSDGPTRGLRDAQPFAKAIEKLTPTPAQTMIMGDMCVTPPPAPASN